MGGFNADDERLYNQHPCHATSPLSVHANTKALTQAYRISSKNLRRGCRPDPVSWLTPEVHAAMERRDSLRLTAEASQLPEDWEAWETRAKETQSLINDTKRSQWRDFCSSLNRTLAKSSRCSRPSTDNLPLPAPMRSR